MLCVVTDVSSPQIPRLTPDALQAVFAFAAEVLKEEDYVAFGKAAA